jgi:hypothetical protein
MVVGPVIVEPVKVVAARQKFLVRPVQIAPRGLLRTGKKIGRFLITIFDEICLFGNSDVDPSIDIVAVSRPLQGPMLKFLKYFRRKI